jgi:hypothetical protein
MEAARSQTIFLQPGILLIGQIFIFPARQGNELPEQCNALNS